MTKITHTEHRRTRAAETKKQAGRATGWRRGGHWAAALLLLLAGAANLSAATTYSVQKVTFPNQGILPNSPLTPVLRISRTYTTEIETSTTTYPNDATITVRVYVRGPENGTRNWDFANIIKSVRLVRGSHLHEQISTGDTVGVPAAGDGTITNVVWAEGNDTILATNNFEGGEGFYRMTLTFNTTTNGEVDDDDRTGTTSVTKDDVYWVLFDTNEIVQYDDYYAASINSVRPLTGVEAISDANEPSKKWWGMQEFRLDLEDTSQASYGGLVHPGITFYTEEFKYYASKTSSPTTVSEFRADEIHPEASVVDMIPHRSDTANSQKAGPNLLQFFDGSDMGKVLQRYNGYPPYLLTEYLNSQIKYFTFMNMEFYEDVLDTTQRTINQGLAIGENQQELMGLNDPYPVLGINAAGVLWGERV